MKERLERLEDKVDKISDTLNKINVTLEVNTQSLVHHIKRTDLLQAEVKQLDNDLEPFERHLIRVESVFKILGVVSLLAGIWKLIKG